MSILINNFIFLCYTLVKFKYEVINIQLRTYKEEGADKILGWISNEREFRLWSADRYEKYSASASDINDNYLKSK